MGVAATIGVSQDIRDEIRLVRVVKGRDREFELIRDLERLSFHISDLRSEKNTHPRETIQVRSFITMDLNLRRMSDA